MSIRLGDKIRHALTDEEGAVVAVFDNTPTCVTVRFGNSFAYLIAKKILSWSLLGPGFASESVDSPWTKKHFLWWLG